MRDNKYFLQNNFAWDELCTVMEMFRMLPVGDNNWKKIFKYVIGCNYKMDIAFFIRKVKFVLTVG